MVDGFIDAVNSAPELDINFPQSAAELRAVNKGCRCQRMMLWVELLVQLMVSSSAVIGLLQQKLTMYNLTTLGIMSTME